MDLLDIDSLFPQLVLALGLALVAGNGLALVQHYRGQQRTDPDRPVHQGRAWFLIAVGIILTVWGALTLVTRS
ncbi:MAG: hypothetical protein KJO36_11895 [Acidimicrobiia bacterium]|nr:hypothetical protein [Acidimicrobiia bacterium]MBT8249893.1 hypothetical protein [Acidimicrobiia bacterium]NNL28062.1 hypothetical protein [Acidimicrobiia bacterium]